MQTQYKDFASKPNIINGRLECGSDKERLYLQALADKGIISGEGKTMQLIFPVVPELLTGKNLAVGSVKTFRSMVFVERMDIKTRTLKSINVHWYDSPEMARQFAGQFKRGLYGALALSESCLMVAEVVHDCLDSNPLNDVFYWGKKPNVAEMIFFCGMPAFSAEAGRDYFSAHHDAFRMMSSMSSEPSNN